MSRADDPLEVARRLYSALADHDLHALLKVLDPCLDSEITRGLPNGWGGAFGSVEELIARSWRPIFAELGLRPVPHEYVPCGGNRVAVLGHYHGRSRTTGQALDAAFAHLLTIADRRIVKLVQVTDSAAWHVAVSRIQPMDHAPAQHHRRVSDGER